MFALDGCRADLFVIAARSPAGTGLFAVDATADGLRRTPLATLDQTRRQARLDLDAVDARLLGGEGAGWAAVERAFQRALVALAAEQAGGAARVLEMAVGHARSRMQSGRPIGSFQAVKHKCADVLIEVESARSAAYAAAAENIQIHGGIGFTWEHPAHLYFKRASSARLMFGDPAHHRERVARLLPTG